MQTYIDSVQQKREVSWGTLSAILGLTIGTCLRRRNPEDEEQGGRVTQLAEYDQCRVDNMRRGCKYFVFAALMNL